MLIFLTNFLWIIFSIIANQPIASETSFFDSGATIFRSLIYSGIWFPYLTFSKRVKNTYPEKQRKTHALDKTLFMTIIATQVIMYFLASFSISSVTPQQINFKNLEASMDFDVQNNCVFKTTFTVYNEGDDVSDIIAHVWIIDEIADKNIGNIPKNSEVSVEISKIIPQSQCYENQTIYEPWFTYS